MLYSRLDFIFMANRVGVGNLERLSSAAALESRPDVLEYASPGRDRRIRRRQSAAGIDRIWNFIRAGVFMRTGRGVSA